MPAGKGILTPYSSAADDAGTANPATPPPSGETPAPAVRSGAATPPPAPQTTTLSMGNPLAGATVGQPAAPAMHANDAINAALTQAFRPIVPDQINSLLGPAMGHLQGQAPPIAYYQPRQAAPIPLKKDNA